jgi:mycothiol system anti-sigma-R factor
MNCKESLEKLYEFLDGDLAQAPAGELEKHLDRCRHCWDRFEFEKKLLLRVKTSCCKECCPERLLKRIKSLLDLF